MMTIEVGTRWVHFEGSRYVDITYTTEDSVYFKDVGSAPPNTKCMLPHAEFLALFIRPDLHILAVPDVVNNPKHYQVFPGVEAIEIIAASLTLDGFHGYCMGNMLKYRLRVGKKDAVQQELGKADKYIELFNQHKHLCKLN